MPLVLTEFDRVALTTQARHISTSRLRHAHVIGPDQHAGADVWRTADGTIHAILWFDEVERRRPGDPVRWTGRRWAVSMVDLELATAPEQLAALGDELARTILLGVEPA